MAGRLVFVCALVAMTNHDVSARLQYLWNMQRYLGLAAYGAIWGVSLVALLAVAVTPSRLGRLIWVVPVAVSTFIADAYYDLTKLHFDIETADAFWQMRFWAKEAVQTFGIQMWGPSAKVGALAALLCLPPRLPRPGRRALLWLPLLPLILSIGLLYRTGGYAAEGLPSQFSTTAFSVLLAAFPMPTWERDPVRIALREPPYAAKIVLIVDESIRADFIDFAHPGGVTPFLAQHASSFVNYGIATAGNICSQPSNAILRMGANPRTLRSTDGRSMMQSPSVWKYAKVAGYRTVFLDGQATDGVLINYMNAAEKALVDDFIQVRMPAGFDNDMDIARRLGNMLRDPVPRFIYINKRGAHFPYDAAYPPSGARYVPTAGGTATADRHRLLNSYRNAVRWSVDEFFHRLLSGLDLKDALIVYTSDHGQNLLEDGDPVTHCRQAATFREAAVPLLVVTGDDRARARFAASALRNRDRASHFQIFPTILQAMGFDTEEIRHTYWLTLTDDAPEPLGYTSGPIFGRFHTRPTWHAADALDRHLASADGNP